MRKDILRKHTSRTPGLIPLSATELREQVDFDKFRVAFSFRCIDRKYPLWDWGKKDLKELTKCLRLVSNQTWEQIFQHGGLRYKRVDKPPRPPGDVPPDAAIDEMRVNERARLMGYRVENMFCVVWFDDGHDACPEGKVRRR